MAGRSADQTEKRSPAWKADSTQTVAVSVAVNRPDWSDPPERFAWSDWVVRGGVEPPTFRFSGGRSYRLSYLTLPRPVPPGPGQSGPDGI